MAGEWGKGVAGMKGLVRLEVERVSRRLLKYFRSEVPASRIRVSFEIDFYGWFKVRFSD